MEITWLGQAGLLIETGGMKILVDPYLSDSVEKINPKNYRRHPVDRRFFEFVPDMIVCTHDHLDHYDPETLDHYLLGTEGVVFLGPNSCFQKAASYRQNHNFVKFDRHGQWTQNGVLFKAVRADHSDQYAIGVLINDGQKTVYITGDTLYNTEIFEDIDEPVDVLILPINGVGNNMNMTDAARFARKIAAKQVMPVHWGMFDELDPTRFEAPGRIIPEIYQKITF